MVCPVDFGPDNFVYCVFTFPESTSFGGVSVTTSICFGFGIGVCFGVSTFSGASFFGEDSGFEV